MTNKESAEFYSKFPRAVFEDQAVRCGIYEKETGRCADLEEIRSVLADISPEHAKLLAGQRQGKALIAGIGFGREIQWLLKETALSIWAVDHSDNLIDDAQKEFTGLSRVVVQKGDILDMPASLKEFDIVQWMWSGIVEFLGAHKQLALKNLGNALAKGGVLILETVYNVENVVFLESNNFSTRRMTLEDNGNKMTVELVSDAELEKLAELAGLRRLCEPYLYLNGKRQLNFFTK